MFSVCYRYDRHSWLQNQWEFVLSHFDVPLSWIRRAPDDFNSYHKSERIETANDLPRSPLVVLAHPEGRVYKGTVALDQFEHPHNAIYFFGGDDEINNDLGKRKPDHLVYIPATHYEMYSYVAAAITLYDRLVKNGR